MAGVSPSARLMKVFLIAIRTPNHAICQVCNEDNIAWNIFYMGNLETSQNKFWRVAGLGSEQETKHRKIMDKKNNHSLQPEPSRLF